MAKADMSPLERAILAAQDGSDSEEGSGAHRIADLRGADLAGQSFRGMDLSGRDLSGANLAEADLTDAKLLGANLVGAILHGAILHGAELMGADLTDAVLDGCDAREAGFGQTDCTRASFFTARVDNASFVGATLVDVDFRRSTADGARFRDADLSGADFSRSELHEADLVDTRVDGACFDEADMQRARMRGVEGFEKARFVAADVRDVDFSHAYLLRRFIKDQSYLEEFRKRSRVHAALYLLWWATSDCGRSVARWGLWILILTAGFGWAYQFVDIDYGAAAQTWLSPYYFSIVTVTTLGYGDVLPTSAGAQALVMLQVVVGYMMLGGLISIFANKMARRAE